MDPFTFFPPEVCDSILQHLTGNEILEASKVSKTWYSAIGASSKTMQKIKLNLFWLRGPHYLTEEMKQILIGSHRRYQNVVMKFQSLHIDDFKLILQSECRNWRSVKFERLVFRSAEELVNMIKICQNTVEELELDNIYVKSGMGLKALNFSQLKVLKIINIEVKNGTINEIFVNCKKLQKLYIISNSASEKSTKIIKFMLKNNRNLKHLGVTSQLVNSVFDEDMSYEFKLDTFISSNYCHLKPNANYKYILINQFAHLKKLSFDDISCPDTLKLIFQIPKLKSLNIGNIDTTVMILSNKHLSVNKSIKEFSYHDHEKNLDFMKCFVDAAPNLKKVEMFSLTQNMMEYMSSGLKELEALKLRTLDVTDLSSRDLFAKLKKIQIDIVSSDLESNILSIPVDDGNPLVMLLKDSNYIVLD